MLLAWLAMVPVSEAKVSPGNRCTAELNTGGSATLITGGASGFSTACTRSSRSQGVSIQCRPSTASSSCCSRKTGRSSIHTPIEVSSSRGSTELS